MVDELADRVLEYGGRATHAQCFLHTINMVAKTLVCEFDIDKKKGENHLEYTDEDVERLEAELQVLAVGID